MAARTALLVRHVGVFGGRRVVPLREARAVSVGRTIDAGAWRGAQQVSRRLLIDYPDDESMRISHETIYQALYIQGRGALKRELTACLRTGRALRVPQARRRRRGKKFIAPES